MSTATARELPAGYTFVPTPPPLDDYVKLRRDNPGLTTKTAEQGEKALAGSWYTCHILHDETQKAVGMGRVIGDGGWYFHIVDMAVLPDHQRKGLGDFIMAKVLEEIEAKAPDGPYINLLTDPPGMKLYRRHGFVESAGVGSGSIGMQRV